MKKIITVLLVAALLFTCFAGCGGDNSGKLKVGIIQYMSHPSLDNCYNGVVKALEESGLDIDIDRQTGSANAAESDCVSFAKNMVSAGYDLIIGIATPAAKAAFAATDNTDIPVIFCAVSDPVAAELVKDMEAPGYNCTGTSDVLDLDAQVEMIKAFQPEVKKIGVLYTSSEENSLTNLANFKKVCGKLGIEVIDKSVQNASDIPAAAEDLASRVECINNFTDNNVVNNLPVLLNAAEKYNIPVYGSEIEQLKSGCLASVSIDYVALGRTTGEMAVEVLKGASAEGMAVKTIKDATTVYNPDALTKLKMTLPDSLKDAEQVK